VTERSPRVQGERRERHGDDIRMAAKFRGTQDSQAGRSCAAVASQRSGPARHRLVANVRFLGSVRSCKHTSAFSFHPLKLIFLFLRLLSRKNSQMGCKLVGIRRYPSSLATMGRITGSGASEFLVEKELVAWFFLQSSCWVEGCVLIHAHTHTHTHTEQ